MPKRKNQHVVPLPVGWAVKREGNSRYTAITMTKIEAVKIARDIARKNKLELVIHKKNGQIKIKDSYGNDPFPPKG